MKISHRIPPEAREFNSATVSEEYQRQVDASVARGEAAYRRAERRLAKARHRLEIAERAVPKLPSRRHLAELRELVEMRRQELLLISHGMTSHSRPSTNRGSRSHKPVNTAQEVI